MHERFGVLTLSRSTFDSACADLLNRVEHDYRPDMLIGIRTGGLAVAEAMARASGRPLPVAAVTCRRLGTAAKRHVPWLASLVAALPLTLADALRIAELHLLSPRRARGGRRRVDAAEIAGIGARLGAGSQPVRLLVVDDAVDTGVTLASVMHALRDAYPEATLRSAVITVTLRSPLLKPDFALYQEVVCRFPWSLDAAR